jgi:cupin 2 domain-containing protein
MRAANVFDDLPRELPEERFTELLHAGAFRVERIVSAGHASPAGFWFDQEQREWVLVLAGAARLDFADGSAVDLRPGSYHDIPAHCRHRVAWTDPAQPTVWLAIHYPSSGDATSSDEVLAPGEGLLSDQRRQDYV